MDKDREEIFEAKDLTGKTYDKKDDKKNGGGKKHGGKKNGSRNPGGDRDNPKTSSGKCSFNNPLWANFNPNLLSDVATLSFNAKVGLPYSLKLDRNPTSTTNTGLPSARVVAPSVMAIEYVTSPGISKDSTSSVNVAAQAMLSYMRSVMNIRNTYDKTDLMMYLLSLDEISTMLHTAMKVARCARVFSIKNVDVSDAWIKAYGIDPVDLRNHHKEYVSRINMLIAKVATLNVPKDYPFFERHRYMAQNIYMDVPKTPLMAQTYLFVPRGFRKFFWEQGVGYKLEFIEWHTVGDALKPLSQLLDMAQEFIDVLYYDEDTANISGDIRNTFGASNMYIWEFMNEDEYVTPIYDSGLQAMIENSRAYPVDIGEGLNVTVDIDNNVNPYIQFDPYVTWYDNATRAAQCYAQLVQPFLNMHWESVTPVDVSYVTRLTSCVTDISLGDDAITTGHGDYKFSSTGSEIITGYSLFIEGQQGTKFYNGMTTDEIELHMYQLNSFDWHPTCWVFEADTFNFISTYTDLDNFTRLPSDVLDAVNDITLMSYWRVPAYGINNVNFKFAPMSKVK